jgi:hypothetical protein
MNAGTKVLMTLLLVSSGKICAQELSHQVLVPAAGIVVTGGLNYTQTIGETAIEIIGSSGFVFTQGFQQPGIKLPPDLAPPGNGVDVYPNPVSDYVNVKLFGVGARKFRIDIISMAGTLVSSGNINFNSNYYYIQQVEFFKFKSGFYIVRVVSEDGVISRTFKIEKM